MLLNQTFLGAVFEQTLQVILMWRTFENPKSHSANSLAPANDCQIWCAHGTHLRGCSSVVGTLSDSEIHVQDFLVSMQMVRAIPDPLPLKSCYLLGHSHRYATKNARAAFETCLTLLEGTSRGWNKLLLSKHTRHVPGCATAYAEVQTPPLRLALSGSPQDL